MVLPGSPSNIQDEYTAQKMKFSIKDFFSKCDHNPRFSVDLVTFTEEIHNEKLHFLCSDIFTTIAETC